MKETLINGEPLWELDEETLESGAMGYVFIPGNNVKESERII